MFKQFIVVAMTVLLSVSASAQSKKKKAVKKKPAAAKTAPAKSSSLPEAAPTAEVEATPVPEAAPVESAPTHVASSGKTSQMNWQPGDGQSGFDLSLAYGMATLTAKSKTTGVDLQKNDLSTLRIGLGYHYGFSAAHSVGVTTAYKSLSTKQTPTGVTTTIEGKNVGLEDIYIVSRNYVGMDSAKLLYGISLGFSPGKHKDAVTTTPTSDGNNNSGGLSLPLYVGYEVDMGGSFWGARLDYDMKMERKTESAVSGGADTATTGGNMMTVKAYYESGIESFWNAYLGYGMISDYEDKVGTGTTTRKGPSEMMFGAAWGTYLSPGMLLALHYDGEYIMKYDYNTTVEIDAFMGHTLIARARWEF